MFRPGDKVRCIQPESIYSSMHNLDADEVYTVDEYTESDARDGDDHIVLTGKSNGGYVASRFVLAKKTGLAGFLEAHEEKSDV